MSSNPIYILFTSRRSLAPAILRWTLAAALLLEIGRAALLAAGISHWQADWELIWRALAGNLPSLLPTPFALIRIILALGLVLGFLTRLWAVLIIIVAIFGYQPHGLMEAPHNCLLEYLVVVCGAAAALVTLGGGRASLDELISRHLLPRIG